MPSRIDRILLPINSIALAVTLTSAQRRQQAVVNVAVVDVFAGTIASDMTVLIDGDTIASVGPTRATDVPRGRR